MLPFCANFPSGRLTLAVLGAERNHRLSSRRIWAGLVGAVANTVAEARLGAVAVDVSAVAPELVLGLRDHVVDAGLLLRS